MRTMLAKKAAGMLVVLLGLSACSVTPLPGNEAAATFPTNMSPTIVASPEPSTETLPTDPSQSEPTAPEAQPTATTQPEPTTIETAPTNTAQTQPTTDPNEPPTPTLEPLQSNTIPDNGNEFEDQLPFSTTANDPGVGSNSGDGIASVTFQFFGPNGQEVYSHTEESSLFCAFGGGDDDDTCDTWLFSEHNNQWPNGNPAQSGPHRLIVTIQGARGGIARTERTATLTLIETTIDPTPTLEPLESNSFPQGDTFGDELEFQTIANDPSVGSENGAGIADVTFTIVDSEDQVVYERTEEQPLYCAFGDGDDEQACGVWRFSEQNNTWPGGIFVQSGATYRLIVTITALSGQTKQEELVFTIEL